MVAERHSAHQPGHPGLVFLCHAPGSSFIAFSATSHSHSRLVSQNRTDLFRCHCLCPRVSVDERQISDLSCQNPTACISRTCCSRLDGHPMLCRLIWIKWRHHVVFGFVRPIVRRFIEHTGPTV